MVPVAGSAIAAVDAMTLVILFGTLLVFWAIDGHLYLRISPETPARARRPRPVRARGWSVAFWTGTLNARARHACGSCSAGCS